MDNQIINTAFVSQDGRDFPSNPVTTVIRNPRRSIPYFRREEPKCPPPRGCCLCRCLCCLFCRK